MWPVWIGLPSIGWLAGSGPLRLKISGNRLTLLGDRWIVTRIAAGKFGASPATICSSASMLPADPPSTTIFALCRAKSRLANFDLYYGLLFSFLWYLVM